jgi:predicted metal-binding membrane protein
MADFTAGVVTVPAVAAAARRHLLPAVILALAVMAWTSLALWSASPQARYLDHGGWLAPAWLQVVCGGLPRGEVVVPALIHAGAWMLMVVAMMLPTTVPLLNVFARIIAGRTQAGLLFTLLVLGYLTAWGGFGLVAHGADWAIHRAGSGSTWARTHAWLFGAAILGLAGAFQFSALKYRCLERCRTPFGFVNARWSGRRPPREAFRIGFDHGLFCVGCCWALMLVMFAVGMGNLGWMLVLGTVMAVEKNLSWGHRIAAPAGIALLAGATATILANRM